MLCRRCSLPNADEMQFCRRCGASLHWQAVVGGGRTGDRQGLIGLIVAAVVVTLGLLFAYVPPFAPLADSGALSPTALATPATTPSAEPTVTAKLTPSPLRAIAPVATATPTALGSFPPPPRPSSQTAVVPNAGQPRLPLPDMPPSGAAESQPLPSGPPSPSQPGPLSQPSFGAPAPAAPTPDVAPLPSGEQIVPPFPPSGQGALPDPSLPVINPTISAPGSTYPTGPTSSNPP